MKKKIRAALPVFLLALCLAAPPPASATVQASTQNTAASASGTQESLNGYVTVNGKTYYYKNGTKHTGRVKIDGVYYYFRNGVMKKSYWYTSASGNKYYFRANGQMAVGRVKIKGTYYYFNTKGKMVTSKKVNINGKYYYFNAKGKMVTSKRVKINNSYYYFNAKGKMVTSKKVKINDNYYYFGSNGKMVTGLQSIDGASYYFGSNGKMLTGLQKIDGNYYYFSSSGKQYTGWLTDESGNQYYFDEQTGIRVTGKQTISHYIRYFDSNGVLYRSVDMDGKMVAVTYDDGPSANTSTILKTLKQYNAVATFFVVGNRVSTYASTVKAAYDQGCEIGNHTWEHLILTRYSASTIQSQISRTNAAVKAVTGVSPVIMRPPGGNYNSTVKSAVNMPLINWSIDTRDWATRSASSTISAVLNYVKDGDIILMHDLYASTAEASKTIIPSLISKGYQLVTVSELAECRGGMTNGTVYTCFR
ncbi:MAG: polysaccharide deacetylase family protein [Lachnospiraceae bacterium]|nr:polysaccharide deacetylase family protein [Lachnospiraceae bacterium]